MTAKPKPPSAFSVLGTLMLAGGLLYLLTGWMFFGAGLLFLAPFTYVAALIWAGWDLWH